MIGPESIYNMWHFAFSLADIYWALHRYFKGDRGEYDTIPILNLEGYC